MNYIYPAIFKLNKSETYTITFPDIPGCITEGKNLSDALIMATDVLTAVLECMLDDGDTLPKSSHINAIKAPAKGFVNLVRADIRDNRAIRRSVSIPSWLDAKASEAGISLSKVLQEALKERLGV